MNFIFGVGGFSREIDWLIEDIYKLGGDDFRIDIFVAEDNSKLIGKLINEKKVISESEFFSDYGSCAKNCFIAVGNPEIRFEIFNNIKNMFPKAQFPNLIHTDVSYDTRPGKVNFGQGNMICSKNIITTDVIIYDFVIINLSCTVGHDSAIGSFTTISPGVNISGNVSIGEKTFLGTGASIIERVNICPNAIIGAGATVVRDIYESGVYVGTPARKIADI